MVLKCAAMCQQVERSLSASAALVSALQARITALTLENRQLADKLKVPVLTLGTPESRQK